MSAPQLSHYLENPPAVEVFQYGLNVNSDAYTQYCNVLEKHQEALRDIETILNDFKSDEQALPDPDLIKVLEVVAADLESERNFLRGALAVGHEGVDYSFLDIAKNLLADGISTVKQINSFMYKRRIPTLLSEIKHVLNLELFHVLKSEIKELQSEVKTLIEKVVSQDYRLPSDDEQYSQLEEKRAELSSSYNDYMKNQESSGIFKPLKKDLLHIKNDLQRTYLMVSNQVPQDVITKTVENTQNNIVNALENEPRVELNKLLDVVSEQLMSYITQDTFTAQNCMEVKEICNKINQAIKWFSFPNDFLERLKKDDNENSIKAKIRFFENGENYLRIYARIQNHARAAKRHHDKVGKRKVESGRHLIVGIRKSKKKSI